MHRSVFLASCSLLALLVAPGPTRAATIGVPDPANSRVPAALAPCPMGDAPFVVTVRDLAANPLAGSLVVLDFSSCPGAFFCDSLPEDPYHYDPTSRWLIATTGPDGSIDFRPRIGGTGPAGSVRVFADGVYLGARALASFDQSGNGVVLVDLDPDLATFTSKLGTNDPTADFDGNGHVDDADQLLFFQHVSHSCLGWVDPVRHDTWGGLKLHYR